jgi:hypothetical protein
MMLRTEYRVITVSTNTIVLSVGDDVDGGETAVYKNDVN